MAGSRSLSRADSSDVTNRTTCKYELNLVDDFTTGILLLMSGSSACFSSFSDPDSAAAFSAALSPGENRPERLTAPLAFGPKLFLN